MATTRKVCSTPKARSFSKASKASPQLQAICVWIRRHDLYPQDNPQYFIPFPMGTAFTIVTGCVWSIFLP